jgi:lysosomal acid lipase/cholesteryl ester hydrolase
MGMLETVDLAILDFLLPGEKPVYSSDPEVNMTVPQIIEYHGYPSEVHTIQTSDGYIIEVHRIPHGINSVKSQSRTPILLMHDIFQSSGEWIMDLPHNSLGYILADEGFDVWLGNVRGNTYGKKHANISPNDNKFWKFGWEEMAEKDLPAMIDYIIEATGEKKVHYLGHSLGATIMYGLLASQPEYNDKLRSFVSFSPALQFNHATSLLQYAKPVAGIWENAMERIGMTELFPNGILEPIVGHGQINHPVVMMPLMKVMLNVFYGVSLNSRLNVTRIPVYLNLVPAGTSLNTVTHLEQLLTSGAFKRFDYGDVANSRKYGAPKAPEFQLELVNAPNIICVSDSDPLVSAKDVEQFSARLSNVRKTVMVSGFDHMDFIWSPDAKSQLWDGVIEQVKKL